MLILEADIIGFMKTGKSYSTSDIYKSLGANKSKDVRTQLDNLYKLGTINRDKISNSYFWTLNDDKNEEDILVTQEGDTTSDTLYKTIIKQLKEEVRFLRCTITDLLNYKKDTQQINSPPPPHKLDCTLPTNTPVIHTNAICTPFLPKSAQPFQTPQKVAPSSTASTISIPLKNRFSILQESEQNIASDPTPSIQSRAAPANSSQPPPSVTSTTVAMIHERPTTSESSQPHPTIAASTYASRVGSQPSTTTFQQQTRAIGPFVNRQPENDRLASARGSRESHTYKIGILGDSNYNKVIHSEMAGLIDKNVTVTKFSYSGATAAHLQVYCDVLLREKPEAVLIHAGTNDIWGRNKRNLSSQEVAIDIIRIGQKCVAAGVKRVYISSILKTKIPACNTDAMDINNILKLMCVNNNFIYIDNSFLNENDLDDAVHLSWDGRRKLVNNYLSILKQ